MSDPILVTEALSKRFGSLTAVDDISISFREDEVCAIIGPNGAGKTTFFNLLSGSIIPTEGTIQFQDHDITNMDSSNIARLGLTRSFQITKIFSQLSVLENIQIAVQSDYNPYNFWSRADEKGEILEHASTILTEVGLESELDTPAADLSHGDQRMLDIAVALGTDPEMLLLDEPTSGMSPSETREVIDLLKQIASELPILIVEHKMGVVRQIADRIIVFHQGEVLADGPPEQIRENEEVREVYLKRSTT